MKFSDTFKAACKKRNLAPKTLAYHMGLSRSAIANWKLGLSSPTLKTFYKLCTVLKMSPNELLGWKDD